MKKIDEDYKMIPWPNDCSACSPWDQEYFGCGFAGFGGRAKAGYQNKNVDKFWQKTCPQYAAAQNIYGEVQGDLADYERGALGNADDLVLPRLISLRTLFAEREAWKSEQK